MKLRVLFYTMQQYVLAKLAKQHHDLQKWVSSSVKPANNTTLIF